MKTASGLATSVLILLAATASVAAAQVPDVYRDPNMDFGSIKTVAVLPFTNLALDPVVSERVRDVFINRLLPTEAVYELPVGEGARGITKAEILNQSARSPEEIVKRGALV